MRDVGVQLRYEKSIIEVVKQLQFLQIPLFQCFLVHYATGKLVKLTNDEIKIFCAVKDELKSTLYVHGSYWINLASSNKESYDQLRREILCAQELDAKYMILHAGSAKEIKSKKIGIEHIARKLNKIFREFNSPQIILENTAHGGFVIGSDLQDFEYLLSLLDFPEQVLFCLDTAHAHAFGYDIMSNSGRQNFFELVNKIVGLDNIAVIHLNDTHDKQGSLLDRHAIIGYGVIGDGALRAFASDPAVANAPIILEPPAVKESQHLQELVVEVQNW
jgi:deoxyribonuclease-4